MRLRTALSLAALLAGTGLGWAQEAARPTSFMDYMRSKRAAQPTTQQAAYVVDSTAQGGAAPTGQAAQGGQTTPSAAASAAPAVTSVAPAPVMVNGGPGYCEPCAGMACDTCCNNHCYTFYGSAEYLLWRVGNNLNGDGTANLPPIRRTVPYVFRSRSVIFPASDQPAVIETREVFDVYGLVNLNPVLFAGSGLDSDDRNGFRLTLGFNLSCDWGVEGNFWMLENQSAAFFANAASDILFNFGDTSLQNQPLDPGPPPVRPPAEAVPTRYNALFTDQIYGTSESKMWGFETNLRGRCVTVGCSRLDALVGFRYIRYEEQQRLIQDLGVQEITFVGSTDDVGTFVPSVINYTTLVDQLEAKNQFFGAQVGLSGEIACFGFFANLTAKVAVGAMRQEFSYSENVFTSSELATVNLPTMPNNIYPYPTAFSETRTRLSWAPELIANVGYDFTDHCRAWVGYDALWMFRTIRPAGGNGPLAGGNGTISNVGQEAASAGPAITHFTESKIVAHGLTFGLQFRY